VLCLYISAAVRARRILICRPCSHRLLPPRAHPQLQMTRAHANGTAVHGRQSLKLMERALDIDFDITGPGLLSEPVCVLGCISMPRLTFLPGLSETRTKQPNFFSTVTPTASAGGGVSFNQGRIIHCKT